MRETKIKIAIRLLTVKFAVFYFKNILKESLEVVQSTHYMITSKKGYLSYYNLKSVKIRLIIHYSHLKLLTADSHRIFARL